MSRGSWPDRIYRWLLRVYPKPFRERFGPGMRHAFDRDERAARARGAVTYVVFWVSAIWDAARFSIGERRAFVRHHAHTREQGALSMRSLFTIDWRDGWRALRGTPIVTTVAVLSIALAIGANTALFSILSALVLRPLPVRNPEQLVSVVNDSWTNPIWEALRARATRIAAGGFAWSNEQFDLSTGPETEMVDGVFASAEIFDVLALQPFRGRMFVPADDDRSSPSADEPVAVISHTLWQRKYQGAGDVIGRQIAIDRQPFTIVGVTPPGFFGPEVGRTADVYVPLAAERQLRGRESALDDRQSWWLSMMFRLRDGQTIDAATAALRAVQPQVRAETIPPNWRLPDQQRYLGTPMSFEPGVSGRSELRGRYQRPLTIVMAVVGATLLIACANIANLLLARALGRRHELSVRLALGASRFRLSRQLFAESAILTSLGTVLGLALAYWGSRALVAQLTTVSARVALDLSLDWRVFAFTTAIAAATAFVFGLSSALGVSGVSPNDAIREQSRGAAGEGRMALRGALVALQVALSLALVVAAGLFTRSFVGLTTRDAGFDRRSVLIASVRLPAAEATAARRLSTLERIRTAAAALPGATHAALAFTTPVFDRGWNTAIATPGTSLPGRQRMSWVNAVSADYFATFGIRFVAGRDIDGRDRADGVRSAIVNEAFAHRFLQGQNPIGARFREELGRDPHEVVGVVQNSVYRSLRSEMTPTMFVPIEDARGSALVAVRASGVDPLSLTHPVAELIRREVPEATVSFRSLEQQVGASVAQERIVATIASVFGMLALLLAGLGLYGVAAYSVNRRRAEIGIRVALGASPARVVRLVLMHLGWMVGAGLAVGAALSVWAGKFVTSLLYGLEPGDPVTLAGAAAVISVVTLLAGWLPARRAARIDPTVVLREG